ncbi:hypothetical protein SY83_15100 [Paenibacillus swuensis]|uniref:HTH marR-type domain-containing protein n=1 Tax=Paenibacillus swuensis TaxID=1178515 RepID=A0A172TPQ1_9BACL|nr:hypothetical protein SY83_15100 [Paenibacillus swuensis]
MLNEFTDVVFAYKNKLLDKHHSGYQYNMTKTKYLMLKTIILNDPCLVVDVSKKLRLSSGATTILLNQLETDGLIVRKRSELDRRSVRLFLTEEGEHVLRQINATREEYLTELLNTLTEHEQEVLIQLVRKISMQFHKLIR